MNFNEAVQAMKDGNKVRRKQPAWGPGMYVELAKNIKYEDSDGNTKTIDGMCKGVNIKSDIFVHNFGDEHYIFGAFREEDMLASDWYILKEENTMNFGEAINAMKDGKKVQREGWNGKGQYIELATKISYVNAAGETINAEHNAIGNQAVAFVGTSGVQLGWLASQADMLANDWKVVE